MNVIHAGRRHALEARDHAALAALMDRNFDLRRCMFGDAALGALNLRMVLAARALGGARLGFSSFSFQCWSATS
jgi:glucuronokinase